MTKTVDINKASLVELKALVYDEALRLEEAQKNISILKMKIQERELEKPREESEESSD